MQNISGTGIAAAALATRRVGIAKVEVKWDGAVWVDETANLINLTTTWQLASGAAGLAMPGDGVSRTAQILLHNTAQRYSPWNSSSPIYASIQATKGFSAPVRISLGYGSDLLRRFTGYMQRPAVATGRAPTATFNCVGPEQVINELRVDSILYQDNFPDVFIESLLTAAGLTSADWELDKGINRIPWAWLVGENIGYQLQKVAAAESGFFFADQIGKFIFHNNHHWLTDSDKNTFVVELDEAMYKAFTPTIDDRAIFSSVRVPYTPRRPGPRMTLYELNEQWRIAPSATETFEIKLKSAAAFIEPLIEGTHYVINDAGGRRLSSAATVTISLNAQSATVTIINLSSVYGIQLRFFQLVGVPLVGQDALYYETPTSSPAFNNTKVLQVPENPFIQTLAQAKLIGNVLADRALTPRPVYKLEGVPALIYLEPADRVRLNNTSENITDVDTYVVRQSTIFGRFGGKPRFHDSLDLVDIAGQYNQSYEDYFIIGRDAPHATDSNKVYY